MSRQLVFHNIVIVPLPVSCWEATDSPVVHGFAHVAIVTTEDDTEWAVGEIKSVDERHGVESEIFQKTEDPVVYNIQLGGIKVAYFLIDKFQIACRDQAHVFFDSPALTITSVLTFSS